MAAPEFHSMAGKVVLVTGGSAGIGRAAALLFARAGAHVVLAARGIERGERTQREIKEAGGSAIFVAADVSRGDQVERLVGEAVRKFGRLDCAFNNAAALNKTMPTGEYTEADFDIEVASNLRSIWLCMKYELLQMRRQQPRGGAIVNTSSINGLGGARNASLYSMGKAGIIALSKSAAQEYAADRIRVNALVAGGFDTEMLHNALSQMAGGDSAAIETTIQRFAAQVPVGRIGHPEEAAQAALWLLSDAASYVTGHAMVVDGGLTAWAR